MTNKSALIRPEWNPATVAMTVLGFWAFWPLGLAMIAYVVFGDRMNGFKKNVNDATDGFFAGCSRAQKGFRPQARTGNAAFDDWRKAELDRLDEERRKLDEMREDFDAYARELQRAKDQEEFNRFMRERRSHGQNSTASNAEILKP